MQKVIVTGAGGFIGRNICRLLLSQKVYVIGIDIREELMSEFEQDERFTPVVAGFELYSRLPEMILDKDIDVFFHFAWNGTFGLPFRDADLQLENAKNAVRALQAAIDLKCKKFVFAGTCNEYETQMIANLDSYSARYTNIYGASKFSADMILRAKAALEGIEYCSGLIAIVYGAGLNPSNMVHIIMSNFIDGKPTKLIEGNNKYDLIHVSDVVRAFMCIGKSGKHMTRYYVGHRDVKTFKEQITRMRDTVSPDSKLLFGEFHETQSLDYSCIDTEKLYQDTGFECSADFDRTMQDTFNWVKENHRL